MELFEEEDEFQDGCPAKRIRCSTPIPGSSGEDPHVRLMIASSPGEDELEGLGLNDQSIGE